MTSHLEATSASRYLVDLARRNAGVYANLPMTRAIIVAGSAAQGVADFYSDLDMMVYYDKLPTIEELSAAVAHNGGINRRVLAERTDSEFMEQFTLRGVECQIAHCTVVAWERDMTSVLEQFDVTSPTQKALSGVLEAIPLHGELLVQLWQAKIAAYPDALARAMVNHYLNFFPLWGLRDSLLTRDATVWVQKMFTEAAENVLGVLAGLNHVYYSPFQLKRMHRLLGKMSIQPPRCGDRIDALFVGDVTKALAVFEPLVEETIGLVESYMPQIDTTRAKRRLGWRQTVWEPVIIKT
jgi:hypothetical protein